jgi:hypothetical protein
MTLVNKSSELKKVGKTCTEAQQFLQIWQNPHILLKIKKTLVRVPGYISRGPGSIPGATTFSEK